MLVSGVYGQTWAIGKDVLGQITNVTDLLWLLVGDFNELDLLSYKKGGKSLSIRRIEKLTAFLSSIRARSVANGKAFSLLLGRSGTMAHESLKD